MLLQVVAFRMIPANLVPIESSYRKDRTYSSGGFVAGAVLVTTTRLFADRGFEACTVLREMLVAAAAMRWLPAFLSAVWSSVSKAGLFKLSDSSWNE